MCCVLLSRVLLFLSLVGFSLQALGQPAGTAKEESRALWLERAQERCVQSESPPLIFDGYSFDLTPEEVRRQFIWTYTSPRRLENHVYFNQESQAFEASWPSEEGRSIHMPGEFLWNVKEHIEQALSHGYADYVFFGDLGDVKFLVPQETWENYPLRDALRPEQDQTDWADILQMIVQDPEVKLLYNTAMFYQFPDDLSPYLQLRKEKRNVVGEMGAEPEISMVQNPQDLQHNTVRGIPGYRTVYLSITVSANQEGCFSFRHYAPALDGMSWLAREYYFDISFFSPEYSGELEHYPDPLR